jgi:hypothetical protein
MCVTRDPVEFAREEMARTTAERIPETTYEAEKEAMDEVITEESLDLDQEISTETPTASQISSFANDIRSKDAVVVAALSSFPGFNTAIQKRDAEEVFQRHFEMDPVVAKAAFVTIYIGAVFVATGGADAELVERIIREANTYREALERLRDSV